LLNTNDFHNDWIDFAESHVLEQVNEIEMRVERMGDFTPSWHRAYHFFRMPILSARVVILGQDPYPQSGVATGRAFEVAGLKSWQQPFANSSLQNMVRAIVKSETGKICRFNEIRKMLSQEIQLLPPDELFVYWEEQGVILLNTALTCKVNAPNSHADLWQTFTHRVLHYLNRKNPELIWFLWGNQAISQVQGISIKNKVFSYHPSRCQPRAEDFLYGDKNCFDRSISPIDWTGFRK
jgi:uracil-DNA glycosylase